MIPVGEDATAATEGLVDDAGDADGQPMDTGAKRMAVCCLDDEVDMVVLHAEVNHAERGVRRRDERAADGREHARGAQATDRQARTERHVHRVRGTVRGPGAMGDARTAPGSGFASGPPSAATPRPRTRQ